MPEPTTSLIFSCPELNANQKLVMLAFAKEEDDVGHVYLNIPELVTETGLPNSETTELIDGLEISGFIVRTGKEIDGNFEYYINSFRLRPPDKYLADISSERLRGMPYSDYLQTDHWKRKRQEALQIQGERCRFCWATEGPFEVDHATYETLGREDAARDLNVLCSRCHEDATARRKRQ